MSHEKAAGADSDPRCVTLSTGRGEGEPQSLCQRSPGLLPASAVSHLAEGLPPHLPSQNPLPQLPWGCRVLTCEVSSLLESRGEETYLPRPSPHLPSLSFLSALTPLTISRAEELKLRPLPSLPPGEGRLQPWPPRLTCPPTALTSPPGI